MRKLYIGEWQPKRKTKGRQLEGRFQKPQSRGFPRGTYSALFVLSPIPRDFRLEIGEPMDFILVEEGRFGRFGGGGWARERSRVQFRGCSAGGGQSRRAAGGGQPCQAGEPVRRPGRQAPITSTEYTRNMQRYARVCQQESGAERTASGDRRSTTETAADEDCRRQTRTCLTAHTYAQARKKCQA